MIYFDNSATTATLPAAAEAAKKYMTELYYNPAAAYSPAVSVERDMNNARANIASQLNATASELVFTSCGTESNNTAIFGSLNAKRGVGRVITTAVEHPSVYESMLELRERGYDVVFIGVDRNGAVLQDELAANITHDTQLVSVMHVNNESGAINDIGALYTTVKKAAPDAVFHVDGVQAFMKTPHDKCDMYSISGHKLHAPKGIAALYIRNGVRIKPYLPGGGQEGGLRSGTSNMPGIMGLNVAIADYAANRDAYNNAIYGVKLQMYRNLQRMRDVRLNGPAIDSGAVHILNVSFLGVRGEVLLNALSEKGLYVSTGSACAANKRGHNRILSAMGINGERQDGAIRFSFSHMNTVDEANRAAQLIEEQLHILRRYKRR